MFTEVSTKNEFYKQPDGAISSYGSTWHNKRIRKRIHVLNHSIVLTLSAAFPTHLCYAGKTYLSLSTEICTRSSEATKAGGVRLPGVAPCGPASSSEARLLPRAQRRLASAYRGRSAVRRRASVAVAQSSSEQVIRCLTLLPQWVVPRQTLCFSNCFLDARFTVKLMFFL
jgi:hypothetical protein